MLPHSRAITTGLVVAVALLLAACTSAEGDPLGQEYEADNPSTWSFDELIDDALTRAHSGSADPQQIDELERAAKAGEVGESQVRAATDAARQCVIEAGMEPSALSSYNSRGVEIYTFTVSPPPSMDPAAADILYDDCDTKHLRFLVSVYSHQPVARAALASHLEDHETELRECLTRMAGRDLGELSIGELWEEVMAQSFGGQEYGYSQEVDCLMESGTSW